MERAFPFVDSEIAPLESLFVHRPDKGIGRITPEKLEDWLYDDTVYLSRMQEEYDTYLLLLLYFLDPGKARRIKDRPTDLLSPDHPEYVASEKVIDVEYRLARIMEGDQAAKERLVAIVGTLENSHHKVQLALNEMPARELARLLITGYSHDKINGSHYLFPPVPNLVFTRDIGIVIKDHLLLSKTLYPARKRESVLAHFLAFNDLYKSNPDKVLEILERSDNFLLDEEDRKGRIISIEGGDIMMISPNHLIVGTSERTSANAANQIVHEVFSRPLGIDKISVVKIPGKRAQMHIDTIFTQVKRNVWSIYGAFSERLKEEREHKQAHNYRHELLFGQDDKPGQSSEIIQFYKGKHGEVPYKASADYAMRDEDYKYHGLERPLGLDGLLQQVSERDFNCSSDEVQFIYSGNNEFPFDEREQWTDSCNYLALREGVVIGYDRNEKTSIAFEQAGFKVVGAVELIEDFAAGRQQPADLRDTLILLPSSELSRARGGSHCMSMPLKRKKWQG